MIIDKALESTAFLEKALQASSYKSEVINSNIANVDTPGYKRKVVNFEDSLSSAIDNFRETGDVDVSAVNPTISEEDYSYRLDENGVVMEEEMVELYENSSRYDVLVSSVNHYFTGINVALGKQ